MTNEEVKELTDYIADGMKEAGDLIRSYESEADFQPAAFQRGRIVTLQEIRNKFLIRRKKEVSGDAVYVCTVEKGGCGMISLFDEEEFKKGICPQCDRKNTLVDITDEVVEEVE